MEPYGELSAPQSRRLRALLLDDPLQAARALLGRVVVRPPVVIRVVEVEVYGGAGEDPASHAFRGPTPRNAVMFGPPGHAYVYLSYGVHLCLNVVAGPPGSGGGLLLRAGEVVAGEPAARRRRPVARRSRDLARGPGRLGAALGVQLSDDGADLLDPGSHLRLGGRIAPGQVSEGPRIGISRAVGWPWRFWVTGDPAVSR